jgi:hypothetical protein
MTTRNNLLANLNKSEIKTRFKAGRTEYVCMPNATPRTRAIVDAENHLSKNPLFSTQTYRILEFFKESRDEVRLMKNVPPPFKKKVEKYIKELQSDITLKDKINQNRYEQLVFYAYLKLLGVYNESDEMWFNIKYQDGREYNPVTQNMGLLRHELGLELYEYDIRAAVPSFIDKILKTNKRYEVYESIDKKTFATLINLHNDCDSVSYEYIIKKLQVIYGDAIQEVLSPEIFNQRGAFAKLMFEYEEQAINDFVIANSLQDFIRCHDAIYTLKKCTNLSYVGIEFVEKLVEPFTLSEQRFYEIINGDKVNTTATKYADYLTNKGFTRVSRGDDEIHLIFTSDKSVDFFPYRSELVSYFKDNVFEPVAIRDKVWNHIAKEYKTKIVEGLRLMESKELSYYKDSSTSIVIPFKNGAATVTKDKVNIVSYDNVDGYFSRSPSMAHSFDYTTTVGDFEHFIYRAATKSDLFEPSNTTFKAFQSMIGYLVSTHKDPSNAICIVLSDENANEDQRKGRRGKSLVFQGISKVRKAMYKGGNDFKNSYVHNLGDLDESFSNYLIDDVPASFNYHDLFTQITGDITCQVKGQKAITIPFHLAPKFMITTNFIFRYDKEDASILGRFAEYKFSEYYNATYQPKNEFNKLFFLEWDKAEWDKFYSFLVRCCQVYLQKGLLRIEYNKEQDLQELYCNEYNFEIIRDAILNYSKEPQAVFSCMQIHEYFQRHSWTKDIHRNNVRRYIEAFLESKYNDIGKYIRKGDKKYYRVN